MYQPSCEKCVNRIFSIGLQIPRSLLTLLILLLVLIPLTTFADFYKYIDESGGVNVTNDYKSIPERYRSAVTVVRESDLQKKSQNREKQIRDEHARVDKQRVQSHVTPSSKSIQESSSKVEPKTEAVAVKSQETVNPVPTGHKLGWLERQLPFLKITGLIVLIFAAAVFVGRLLSTYLPRTLGIVIRIALFCGVAVYVFNAFSDRISNAFVVMKSETEVVQKAVDKRSESIEKHSAER